MKLLVIGATGKTGQKILEQLSTTKYDVTGLIRKPEQAFLIEQYHAKTLLGDLEGNVADIARGFDVILFVAGSGGKNVQGVDYEGLCKVVDSATTHQVTRFLYLSSINIDKEPTQYIQEIKKYYQEQNETVPEKLLAMAEKPGYKFYLDMKTLAEKKIIASDLNYTIFRAGLLTQELGSGKVAITSGKLNAFGKISRDNVAQCFIEALDNESTYQKIFTILDDDVV